MPTSVTTSAPGKLMLLGEHAVVYGYPALVTAVGQRMKATLTLLPEPVLELHAPGVKVEHYRKPLRELGVGEIPKGAGFVEIAVRNLRAAYPFEKGVRVETKSEFSSLFGFGSSSASTVCVLKGLSELLGLQLDARDIFDLALKTVMDVQKKGSGFDVAAATYGGTLFFEIGGRRIEPVQAASLPLIVGYTGIKADTVSVIDSVAKKFAGNPAALDAIYASIGELTLQAKDAIAREDWSSLGALMNENQKLLESLGVSGEKLDAMIRAAQHAGAFGAKLSGAGVGDCMIAVAPPDRVQAITNALTAAGGQVIDVAVHVEGMRLE